MKTNERFPVCLWPRARSVRLGMVAAAMMALGLPSAGGVEVKLDPTTVAATVSQWGTFNAQEAVDGIITPEPNGWALGSGVGADQTAVFEAESEAGFLEGTLFIFRLYHHYGAYVDHNLGRFRLSVTTDSRDDYADGLQDAGDVTANWVVLEPLTVATSAGSAYQILPDKSVLVPGAAAAREDYTVTARTSLTGITGFRLEALADPSLPGNGPGRAGNFVLSEFTIEAVPGGDLNRALQLTTGDYVLVPDSESLHLGTSATIEAYLKYQSGGRILSKGWESPDAIEFMVHPTGPVLAFVSAIPEVRYSTIPFAVDTWTHVALVREGEMVRFFVNGELDSEASFPGHIMSNTVPLHLGINSLGYGEPYTGLMDEVRLWNRALSGDELRANLRRSLAGTEAGLVGYWNFNDGTANDLTPNNNHGAFIGSAAAVVSPIPGFGGVQLPVITSVLATNAAVGSPFAYTITVLNGPASFSAQGLPLELSLDPTTGVISGTPATAGPYTVTLSAVNAAGTSTVVLKLVVETRFFDNGNIAWVDNAPTAPTVFVITQPHHVTRMMTYHWNYGSGQAPGTLGLRDQAGTVFGPWPATLQNGVYWWVTPDTTIPSGTYTLEDSDPATWAQNSGSGGAGMAWVIGYPLAENLFPPTITSPLSAAGALYAPFFSYRIAASGNPTSFNATDLPAGLSVDPATGLISGRPAVAGSFAVTLQAVNTAGTGQAVLALTVRAPVYDNTNLSAVSDNPPNPTLFTLDQGYRITHLFTYHYNFGDRQVEKTIGVRRVANNRLYGPWPVTAYSETALNSHWWATPDAALPAGTYEIVDSDPPTWSHTGDSGFAMVFGDPAAVPEPIAITRQPVSQTVSPGGAVTLEVVATGALPITYQWKLNGQVLDGATDATLTIAAVTPEQAGTYTVTLKNSVDELTSSAATVSLLNLDVCAVITLAGPVGATYQIDYSTDLGDVKNWQSLTNLALPTSPHFFIDWASAGAPKRFYRAIKQ